MPRASGLLVWTLLPFYVPSFAQPVTPRRVNRPWGNFGNSPQHTALASARSQHLEQIRWSTTIDFQPVFDGSDLIIHYGSPLVTAGNTVIFPVKLGVDGDFRVDARSASDGSLVWSTPTDYVLPPHTWVPVVQPALALGSRVYFPGAGGTLYYRDDPDSPDGRVGQAAFYGMGEYSGNRAAYDAAVRIDTPLTADARGNIYFGFEVAPGASVGLESGIARIGSDGRGAWISASSAAGEAAGFSIAQNCAPAVSGDGATIYIAVSDADSQGYLVALDSETLAPKSRIHLLDPATGDAAILPSTSTASPMIGPDGDVYFGVFDSALENHFRGWLLHFDALLSESRTPGAFGWDDTPSVVPTSMVPSYTGRSPYLLMTKYNNYLEVGGDGQNRVAVLDPNQLETDPVTGVPVMQVVASILGPTLDGSGPGVLEWCINSAAVDPFSHSVIVNNEDGSLYRWDLVTNSFTETLMLTGGVPEAYTPTAIGPDGTVYAINNSMLFAIGSRVTDRAMPGGMAYHER